jgi:hypothetical protein
MTNRTPPEVDSLVLLRVQQLNTELEMARRQGFPFTVSMSTNGERVLCSMDHNPRGAYRYVASSSRL